MPKRKSSPDAALKTLRAKEAREYTSNPDAARIYRDGFTDGWHFRGDYEHRDDCPVCAGSGKSINA